MKTLVAAPICKSKLYSLPQWAAATQGHHRFLVTEEPGLVWCLGHVAPVSTYDPPDLEGKLLGGHAFHIPRFNAAWEVIIQMAEMFDYTHILSLESDVIPPEGVDIVGLMESQMDDTIEFLVHLYPYRINTARTEKMFEMGCTMARTETWRRAIRDKPENMALYQCPYQTVERNPKFHFKVKTIDLVPLQHIHE